MIFRIAGRPVACHAAVNRNRNACLLPVRNRKIL